MVLAIGLSGVFAEESTTTQKKAIESFAGARDQRTKLLTDIQQLNTQLDEHKSQKREMSETQAEKRNLESRISKLDLMLTSSQQKLASAATEEKKDLEERIQAIKDRLDDEKSSLESLKQTPEATSTEKKDVEDKIKNTHVDLVKRQADLNAAEYRINELLNSELPRQKFKLLMSATFAALVGLVIVGFFYIAWGDERVRQAIFSGTAGIQFVTLFSVVIAIILFGIIEILEGKELAALLGGLSGYILGRATSEHASAQPEQPSRDQIAPLGTQPQPPVQSQLALQPSVGNGAAQHAQP